MRSQTPKEAQAFVDGCMYATRVLDSPATEDEIIALRRACRIAQGMEMLSQPESFIMVEYARLLDLKADKT